MRQKQALLCARNAHVSQPAFLLQRGFIEQRSGQREYALLHAHQKYRVEFQTLGRVQRHQRHRAAGLIHIIDIRNQRHVFQKFRKSGFGIQLLIFAHRAFQFADIFDARLVFLGLARLQRAHIAGLFDQFFHEIRKRFIVHRFGQRYHQIRKRADLLHRARGKAGIRRGKRRRHQ